MGLLSFRHSGRLRAFSFGAVVIGFGISVLLEILSVVNSEVYVFSASVFLVRFLIALIIINGILIYRSVSEAWSTPIDFSRPLIRMLMIISIIVLSLFLSLFVRISGQAAWLQQGDVYEEGIQHTQNGNQYNLLADSIINGRFDLDLPVSDILLSMDNPYDTQERIALNSSHHDDIYWDYAYYDGHYYCYFGVLPCLLLFVPYKLITGLDLRTDIAVLLFAVFACVAALIFLKNFSKVFFKNISIGQFFSGYFAILLMSGIFEQVYLPRIYPIPILSSLFFCFAGLSFWLEAKKRIIDNSGGHLFCLIIGSICVAATLGCRPQYVLCALLAFGVFSDEIKHRFFFSAKGAVNTAAVIIPFFVVAIPILIYNYVRFESPFDFGASYNLTGADMTSYTFDLTAIAVKFYEYLFLPFSIIKTFPFIAAINETNIPAALWTNEPFYAGYFLLVPISFYVFCLMNKTVRKRLREHRVLIISYIAVILTFVIIIIICYVSGVTMRYFSDFGWLLGIVSVAVYWTLPFSKASVNNRYLWGGLSNESLHSLYVGLLFCGYVLYFSTFLGTARIGALWAGSPHLFQMMERVFSFL